MPQGFTESPYFSHILKADLDDIKFPRASNLLQYVDDLVLFSFSGLLTGKHHLLTC